MLEAKDFLPAVRALCLEAGAAVMRLRAAPLTRERKPDNSLVTNADRAADAILSRGLRAAFPGHAVLSEETGLDGSAGAPYVWLVDPLDGTRAYAHGKPGFSVMAGLLFEGTPVLGVVYDPLQDDLYEAARGSGAHHTRAGVRSPARVSGRAALREAKVIASAAFPPALKAALAAAFPAPWAPPVNSVGVKVGLVARGAGDVYVGHHPVHLWDTCAPLVVLEEAGGRMTLWDGRPLAYPLDGSHVHPAPTLATNGVLHEAALRVLAISENAG